MRNVMTILKIVLAISMVLTLLKLWITSVKRTEKVQCKLLRILVVFGFIVLFSLVLSVNYQPAYGVANFREQMIALIEQLRYGGNQKKEEQLIVQAEKEGNFYLRGAVYDSYVQGKWSDTAESVNEPYRGMLQYLEKRQFYPQAQIARCANEEPDLNNTITIQNIGASRKYVYVPLTVSMDGIDGKNQKSCDRILPESFWGDQEYTVKIFVPENQEEYELTQSDNRSDAWKECEVIYRAYVYDHYLAIPETEREMLDHENLEAVGGTTQYEVLESVRSYLNHMEKQSAEEYASKAALLLRYCGIATRYVDGYYVEYCRPDSKQVVSLSDQHQWIEVYLDGVGFATFETDPSKFNATATIAESENVELMQHDIRKVNQKQETERSEPVRWSQLIPTSLLLVMALAFYLKMKTKRQQDSKNMMEFASFLCIRLEKVLKYDNVILDIKRPYQYQQTIREQYGEDLYSSYMRFIYYTDEIQFNDGDLSEDEQTDMKSILRSFEMHILEKVHPIRRMWIRR